MEKELRLVRRKVSHIEDILDDNIARLVLERFTKDKDKFVSILKKKSEDIKIHVSDDFTEWVDTLTPYIARSILESNHTWYELRQINGLIESLCEMYYIFDLPIF